MIVLGLTGSIGMGKSTVATMLKKLGAAVHDSDAVAREAISPSGFAFEDVALAFPEAWDKKKHLIKKEILAEIIFNDEDKKKLLENIIHPVVRKKQKEFIQKQKRLGKKIIVLDIPLLFETGGNELVDYVVTVSAPYHVQRHRVLNRLNMTEEKFAAILKNQMPDKEKCFRADFVIPTGLGMAYTHQCLVTMLENIK